MHASKIYSKQETSMEQMKELNKNPLAISYSTMKLVFKKKHLLNFNLVIKNIHNYMKRLFK
jgi:hypothetical protein